MTAPTTQYVRVFDTFGAFVDAAENDRTDERSRTSRESYRASWFGTRSFDEAVQIARSGWPEGRAAVERLSVKIAADILSSLPIERMDNEVSGGSVDVGAYLAGDPACFIVPAEDDSTRMRQGRGPIVRIVAHVSVSANVSTDTITRRGAAVVALTDALQRLGYRVEIVGTWATAYEPYRGEIVATIKRPEEAVQIDQLAFALAHPSTFRRLAFSVYECAPANIRQRVGYNGGGYGTPTHARAETVGTSDITLPEANSYERAWSDDASAERWVREALAAQGVTLEAS